MDDINIEIHTASMDKTRTLPLFKLAPSMTSLWGDLSGERFMKSIYDAYAQVVNWRPKFHLKHVASNL